MARKYSVTFTVRESLQSPARFPQELRRNSKVLPQQDRFFLGRIATHVLAFEDDSHIEWFEGNFADYEEDKKRRLRIDSVIPHRLKYKKFSRRGGRPLADISRGPHSYPCRGGVAEVYLNNAPMDSPGGIYVSLR
jgi:hypothetical protein